MTKQFNQDRVTAATKAQQAAWAVWDASPTDENMAAWDRAVAKMRVEQQRAADMADRWEMVQDADEQAPWWVAAKANARVSA